MKKSVWKFVFYSTEYFSSSYGLYSFYGLIFFFVLKRNLKRKGVHLCPRTAIRLKTNIAFFIILLRIICVHSKWCSWPLIQYFETCATTTYFFFGRKSYFDTQKKNIPFKKHYSYISVEVISNRVQRGKHSALQSHAHKNICNA